MVTAAKMNQLAEQAAAGMTAAAEVQKPNLLVAGLMALGVKKAAQVQVSRRALLMPWKAARRG